MARCLEARLATKNLPVAWTKGVPEDKKDDFEKALRASTLALGRLSEILEEGLRTINNVELSVDEFSSPSWAYKMAYLQGKKAQLREILTLVDFINNKER